MSNQIPSRDSDKEEVRRFLRVNENDPDTLFLYYEHLIHNIQPDQLSLVFEEQKPSFLEFFSTKPDVVVSNLRGNIDEFTKFSNLFLDASDKVRILAIEQSLWLLKNNPKTPSQALNLMLKCLVKKFDSIPNNFSRCVSQSCMYHGLEFSNEVRSKAAVILARLLEINASVCEQDLDNEIENAILCDSPYSLQMAFSTLNVLFHINSSIAARLFFKDYIQKRQFSIKNFLIPSVTNAGLELLSSAYVNKECRASIANNFGELVNQVFNESTDSGTNVLAASILVKIKANSESSKKEDVETIIELSSCIEDYLTIHQGFSDNNGKENVEENLQKPYGTPLETLAYTSLLLPVKIRIITNKVIMDQLIFNIKNFTENHPPWVYCSLSILANLSQFPPPMTQEQKKVRELKGYAGKSVLDAGRDDDISEDLSHIIKRIVSIIDTGIISIISQLGPKLTMISQQAVVILFRNLVIPSSTRSKFVQQGGLTTLLYFYIEKENIPRLDLSSLNVIESGLAKTLISVDPSLVFSQKLSPQVVVRPLIDLLMSDDSPVILLDTFESLLALTNIASFDEGCRRSIMRVGWTKIENLFTSTNTMVQRASLELVCNLSMSEVCAEKFLDSSSAANSRLSLISALTDLEDRAAKQAAAGALAMLSEWQIPTFGRNMKVAQCVVDLLNDKEEEILSRACVILGNITSTKDEESLKLLLSKGVIEAISRCIKFTGIKENIDLLKQSQTILVKRK